MTATLIRSRFHVILIGLAVLTVGTAALIGVVFFEVVHTGAVRGTVQAYTRLIAAANRQDMEAVRRLCSARYLRTHALGPAAEGGVMNLPRNIDPHFQAWRHGAAVWLCPTNRVGPVFQFVFEEGGWKFDGPVGSSGRGDTSSRCRTSLPSPKRQRVRDFQRPKGRRTRWRFGLTGRMSHVIVNGSRPTTA